MPISKNQQERLYRINERLNRWNGQSVALAELARWLTVSERTVKDDIRYMREVYGAPIVHDRRQGGYRYAALFDLAASVILTDNDLAALHTAVATLNQFRPLALFEGLRGTVDKIDKAVRFRSRETTDLGRYILFESVPFSKGGEWIGVFLKAIHEQAVVRFDHRRYDTEITKTHRLYPYAVKEHRNRWYVVGWQLDYGQIRVFGLDRILPDSAYLTDEPCNAPDFNAETYFQQGLGVAVYDQPAEEVILSFRRQQGLHFQAQPFYPFRPEDVLVNTEAEFRVRLTMIVNDELLYELARLGDSVKVIAPVNLVQRLKGYFQRALDQYV